MKYPALLLVLFFGVALSPRLALGDAREAVLTRAVAAKEMALDHPEPARWQEAFDRFLEADAAEASSDTKYELGFIAAQLKQEDLAVNYYEDAILLGLGRPALDKAIDFLARIGPTMARLQVRGSRGLRVRIRGIDRGTLPLARPIVVFAGVTQLDVIGPLQSRASSRMIMLEAGKTTTLDLAPTPSDTEQARTSAATPIRPSRSASLGTQTQNTTRPVATWFLGVGAGMMLSSSMLIPVSMAKLGSKRDQLEDACGTPSNSRDGCGAAKPGRYEEALDLANEIAGWKTVRTIGWTGLGIGAASVALGITLLVRGSAPTNHAARLVIVPAIGSQSLTISWNGVL